MTMLDLIAPLMGRSTDPERLHAAQPRMTNPSFTPHFITSVTFWGLEGEMCYVIETAEMQGQYLTAEFSVSCNMVVVNPVPP